VTRLSAYLWTVLWLAAFVVVAGCDDGELRGAVSRSADGGTYFGVSDGDGGGCGQIYVDGKPWTHAQDVVAPIAPGAHTIKICSEIAFNIAPGTTYLFDYWGP
jgi:hypothetical protein